ASVKRWAKEYIYNRLPFWVGPLGYFFYRYFIQLGFLDGRSGLIYHFLQGFWYRFLVGAKIEELERMIIDCRSNEERLERLAKLTGLKIVG
ncbi:MAG: glycosyltransferase family 2 protein, partial [Sphingobium sp.]